MIIITLKDLVYIVPDLINLFLSGFIFVRTYNWMNSKKTDISFLTVESLFISFLIQSFYSALHDVFLSYVSINYSLKILIYSVTGFLLAIIFTFFKRSKFISVVLYKINNKSINNDIFDDVIDYQKRTLMRIFIKSSNLYYIGKFSYREENGINSWICLIDYCSVDSSTNDTIFDPSQSNIKSSVIINCKDIERIELVYENGSEVWNRMTGA